MFISVQNKFHNKEIWVPGVKVHIESNKQKSKQCKLQTVIGLWKIFCKSQTFLTNISKAKLKIHFDC